MSIRQGNNIIAGGGSGSSIDPENAAAILTELQTKYAQGKIALAKVLTNKGEPTESKEEIISMVDKVNNLNVESNVTNIKARVWASAADSVGTTSQLCAIKLFNKRDFILFVDGKLYYIPDGVYSSVSEVISAASFSLQTPIDASSSSFSTYFTMCVSANNTYLLLRGNSGTSLYLYKINADSFEAVNENIITTTSTNSSTSYASFIAVSDDGNVIAFCKSATLILYNVATATEFSFTASKEYTSGGHFFLKDNKVYSLSLTSSGLTKKIHIWSYHLAEDGTITATLDVNVSPVSTSAHCNILHSNNAVYFIAMTARATSDYSLGAYDIYNLYFCEFDQMIGTAPTPAQFKCFPIEWTSSLGNSRTGLAMAISAQINDTGETVEITFSNMLPDEKFIYNKATRTVTSNKEIHITQPGQYGLNYSGFLDANGNYMLLGNTTMSILPRGGAANTFVTLLDGAKIIAKKAKKLDGAEIYYVAGNGLHYSNAQNGYYDAEITVTPETE